jgi:hypothetical protein
MNSAKFVYTFEMDAASAQASAQKLKQIYQQSLAEIKVPGATDGASGQAAVAAARTQQAQLTADARAQANERSAAARAEAQERINQSKAAANAQIEADKRVTAQVKADIAEQASARRSSSSGGGGGGGGELIPGFSGLSSIAGYTIGGLALGAAAKMAVDAGVEADRMETSYRRTAVAATNLAGSQANLNTLMNAYTLATGGAVDKSTALTSVTGLMSIGFADNAQELTKFVSAARGISIATGRSQEYVTSQLQLAIANQSTMRLDQLGLGVSEVKKRIDDLKEANKGLSTEEAYQQAILGLADEKFGALTRSSEAAATGLEKLTVGWANFRLEASKPIGSFTDKIAGGISSILFPQLNDYRDRLVKAQSTEGLFGPLGDPKKFTEAINLIDDLNKKIADGKNVPLEYAQLVTKAAEEVLRFGNMGADTAEQLSLMEDAMRVGYGTATQFGGALDTLSFQSVGLIGAMGGASAAVREFISAGEEALNSGALSAISAMVAAGTLSPAQAQEALKTYQAATAAQAGGMATKGGITTTGVALAQAQLGGQINSQTSGAGSIAQAGQSLLGDLLRDNLIGPAQYDQMMVTVQNRAADFLKNVQTSGLAGPALTAAQIQAQQEALSPGQKIKDTEAARIKAERESASAGKKAMNQWESTAKKVEKDFISAAKKMSDDFESSLHQIPGLFSTTDVSDLDIAKTKAGIYEPKADEYIRRLADEVESGKDKYSDVDIKDAAKALGVSDKLDPKLILELFRGAWNDQSLFYNRDNLKFIDQGAVAGGESYLKRRAQGERNILDYEGLNPAVTAAAGYQGILPGRLLTGPNGESVTEMGTDAGTLLATGMFKGFQDQAKTLPWVQQIIQTVASQVSRDMLDDLNSNANSDIATSESVGVTP